MKRTILIATTLALAGTACSPDNDAQAIEAAEVQPIVDTWAEDNDVSKLAVSVISPSGETISLGYGADGQSPDGSTLFVAGSLGKTMMAATTLALVEDGVLDLDEPIERWLPDFPRSDEITLRQLLSHTAGLQNPLFGQSGGLAGLVESKTPSQLVNEAANAVETQPLPAPHRYSTAGYWAAGAVIEAATGQSLADAMQQHVFDPLDMADTYLDWPGAIDQELVGGELTLPDGTVEPLGTEAVPPIMTGGWGPGGVLSSSDDVATFYHTVLDDLLTPASVETMTTPPPQAGDYGLGIDSERWSAEFSGWGHGGLAPGYRSAAGVTDDGWTVVVLTNHFDLASGGRDPDPQELIGELLPHLSANN